MKTKVSMSGLVLTAVTAMFCASSLLAQDIVTYYHTDAMGSPIAATDANGNLLWRESYSPYGERLLQENSPRTNRMWFTGHHHDEDSGLTYAGARHYDPMIGRFMGVDPAAADAGNQFTFNRYAYGNNNPYRYEDPDGRETGAAYRTIYLLDGGLKAPPPRSPDDRLGPAIGVALGAMMAPVAAAGVVESYIAYMAAPEVATLLAESVLLGDALGPGGIAAGSAVVAASAQGVNAAEALARKLGAIEKAQSSAVRTSTLLDGRVRYYGAEVAARTPGPTRGASLVTESNPATGQVRQWMESYDQAGNVVRVHPKMIDGQVINSQHYPPTGAELGR